MLGMTTLTPEQLENLKPGDLVWRFSAPTKMVVEEVRINPPVDWMNSRGRSKVITRQIVHPHPNGVDAPETFGPPLYMDVDRLTLATRFYGENLRPIENQILDDIQLSGRREANLYLAMMVWRGQDGLEMGPCRWSSLFTLAGYDHFSVSPFAGAWKYIKRSDILRVRDARDGIINLW